MSWELDHGYGFPLVDRSPGVHLVDVLDAERLGLPAELGRRLAAHADRWEELAMRDVDGTPADELAPEWSELGLEASGLLREVHRRLQQDGVELVVDREPVDRWLQRDRRRTR